ncbi:MAG: VOC family protein [Candidatus Omnitrophica bacterium]|nr:VOC family protein [Candidatus Omnitrophota bacterium]MCB9747993.1 VOC family protein [Candidatus Omnitrophota bacterium]
MSSLKPNGLSWVTPHLIVTDVLKSIDFYQSAFGFELMYMASEDENGNCIFARMRYKDQNIIFSPEGSFHNGQVPLKSKIEPAVILYLYCEDVDAKYEVAVEAGAKVLQSPKQEEWGDRVCRLQDSDGYVWDLASYVQDAESK